MQMPYPDGVFRPTEVAKTWLLGPEHSGDTNAQRDTVHHSSPARAEKVVCLTDMSAAAGSGGKTRLSESEL